MGLVLAYLVYYNHRKIEEKNKELAKYIEGLSHDFDSAAKHAIFNMPFPMVFIDEDGKITWYNTPFLTLLGEEEIVNKSISELVPDFNLSDLRKKKENEPMSISYLDRYFDVYPNFLEDRKTSGKGSITVLYWVDDTDHVVLEKEHNRDKTVVALSQYEGIVRKYENDKYMVVLNQGGLEAIKGKRFDLLDQIRDMDMGNTIPITLSIGVCQAGKSLIESYGNASAAIDIALGRGGDQAVINVGNAFDYYGGKSKAMEKRNKVKARVIGDALRQLIDQNERVFVMGHKNPDMDSIGSSVGIMRAIDNRNKEAYLVLNGENPSIRNLMDRMRKDSPDMVKRVVTGDEARDLVDERSLLIVVDNHKPSLTEAPELLELTQKVVVIDHHRRAVAYASAAERMLEAIGEPEVNHTHHPPLSLLRRF